MAITETEAKTKWCPVANTRFITNPASERVSDRCVGSACMAWRWEDAKRTQAFLEAVQARMKTQDKPNFGAATNEVYAESGPSFEHTEGFCGLAGRP